MLRLLRLKMCLVRENFFSFEICMTRAIYYMPFLGKFDFLVLDSRKTSFFVFVMIKSR